MFALISPEKTQIPPGAVMRLPATWEDYQILCQQRSDRTIPRLKYRSGEVIIMSPLPKHGRDAHVIASIITTLLDYCEREFDAFTPITMELPQESGIEPDYCFYIDNWQAISGKNRIIWTVDPPPDLVLEIDVTSYTDINDYIPYQVPEIWLYKQKQLLIYQLHHNSYLLQQHSLYFPSLDIHKIVQQCLETAYNRNTSAAIRELRKFLNS